ncbi:hypothetical protein, partial [Sphingopyxis alaskensis]|uniref:hypothetical protein n=1 Tax=Sphingopyxis alaskensis TaxID=117207 RepID=UPI003919DC5E
WWFMLGLGGGGGARPPPRAAVRRASGGSPSGAGRFWPIATLLVGRDVPHRAAPRASRSAKIASVTVGQYHVIALYTG